MRMRDFTMKLVKNAVGLVLTGVGIMILAADEINISSSHKGLYYVKQPNVKVPD